MGKKWHGSETLESLDKAIIIKNIHTQFKVHVALCCFADAIKVFKLAKVCVFVINSPTTPVFITRTLVCLFSRFGCELKRMSPVYMACSSIHGRAYTLANRIRNTENEQKNSSKPEKFGARQKHLRSLCFTYFAGMVCDRERKVFYVFAVCRVDPCLFLRKHFILSKFARTHFM